MFEVSEAAKAAKVASYSAQKLESLRAWSRRERESIAPVARALMASIPDRALRDIAETIDRVDPAAGEIELPRIGKVAGDQVRMIRGWVVGEVKSRHVVEWHAASDCGYDWLAERAAELQGVSVDAIDYGAVPDELFDAIPNAYECALRELGPTSAMELVEGVREVSAELEVTS